MRFQQIGRTVGDETTPYKVTDFKSRTVGEFIQEVLKENPNEWGYISVGGHFLSTGTEDYFLRCQTSFLVLRLERFWQVVAGQGWTIL